MPEKREAAWGPWCLTFTQVADRLGLSRNTVRQYKLVDPEFPKPVTPKEFRSALFDPDDVDEYKRKREERSRSNAGRGRPVSSIADERRTDAPDIAERIRAAIRSGEHSIKTQKELASRLNISVVALTQRFNGKIRWKRGDLRLIARELKIDVTTDNVAEDKKPAAKKTAAAKVPAAAAKAPAEKKTAGKNAARGAAAAETPKKAPRSAAASK